MEPEVLKQLTIQLLALFEVEVAEIKVTTGYRTVVAVSAPDTTVLIGPNGEHLRSLNTILKRLVETKHGETAASFLLDVNGYHEGQMERVREGARMFAQRARLFKHDVEMPPCSPYERLVVHELFADDPDISTESAGEGKFRHIVLKYSATARA